MGVPFAYTPSQFLRDALHLQLAMAIRAAESREALRQRAGAAQDRAQRTLLAARDNEEALNE